MPGSSYVDPSLNLVWLTAQSGDLMFARNEALRQVAQPPLLNIASLHSHKLSHPSLGASEIK